MIEYLYFVKFENDRPFDNPFDWEEDVFETFDEAKEFAKSNMSSHPEIHQTEIVRNDFGECVDSRNIGLVWSWQDEMSDIPNDDEMIFTKDETFGIPEIDHEFTDDDITFETDCVVKRPMPEGMSIRDLIEAMEENEDEVECAWCNEIFPKDDCTHTEHNGWLCDECSDEIVECTWCEELYDKSSCRYEVNLGWLCHSCEGAIKSRGERLTFSEDYELEEDFKHLANVADAKEQILAAIKADKGAQHFFINGKLRAPAAYKNSNWQPIMTDFIITKAGKIEVVYTDKGETSFEDLDEFMDDLRTGCVANKVLKCIKSAAKKLDSANNPRNSRVATQIRNQNIDAYFRSNPDIADEFRNHIVNISFKIPKSGDEYELGSLEDKDGNRLMDFPAAIKNIKRIHDNFYNSSYFGYYGQEADDAGIVEDRLEDVASDTWYGIANTQGNGWGAVGKITFDTNLRNLPNLHAAINITHGEPEDAKVEAKRTIDNVRLAQALIKHFDDVKFYEHSSMASSEVAATVVESYNPIETVDLDYDKLTIMIQGPKRDVDDWDEVEYTDSYTYCAKKGDVALALWEDFLTEEDVADVPGGFDALEDDKAWNAFLDKHFDDLFEKYYDELCEYFRDAAKEAFENEFTWDEYQASKRSWNESCSSKSMLEELEDADAYSVRLTMCPECGETSYDPETGFCISCGFN